MKKIHVFPKQTWWHHAVLSRWTKDHIYCSGSPLWGLYLREKDCPMKHPGSRCPLFSLERREHDGNKADSLEVWQDLSSSLSGKRKNTCCYVTNGDYERSKRSFSTDFSAIQRELERVACSAFPYTAAKPSHVLFPNYFGLYQMWSWLRNSL